MGKGREKAGGKKKAKRTGNQRQSQAILTWIFSLSILLYANTISHEYALDDSVIITDNQYTKQGIKGIGKLVSQDLFSGIYGQGLDIGGGRWRPLPLITHALEWQLFGESPAISHFLNVILFAFSMVFLWRFLNEVFKNHVWLPFLTVLIFIFHPVHTEVVANIKSRDEILSLLFLSLSGYYFFRHLSSNSTGFPLNALLFFGLALLSKENGITFLLIFPLMLVMLREIPWKKSLRKTLPFFIVALIYLVIRTSLVGIPGDKTTADLLENHFFDMSFNEKAGTLAYIFLQYIKLLFFPHPLSSDYSYAQTPVVGVTDPFALMGFGMLLLLLFPGFKWFKSPHPLRRNISFGILFFLINLGLVSNLFFNIGAPLGERFAYIPSLGFSLVLASAGGILFRFREGNEISVLKKTGPLVLFGLLFLAGGFKIIQRNADWKNNETLFSADVNHASKSAKVHYYLANTLLGKTLNEPSIPDRSDILNRSKKHFYRALSIYPKFHTASYNLGLIYKDQQMADSAIYVLEKAIELAPPNLNKKDAGQMTMDKIAVNAMAVLGTVYGQLKNDLPQAVKYLEMAVKYNPGDIGSTENLAIAYAMMGKIPEAISQFERAINLNPKKGNSYLNLGKLYANSGNPEKAQYYFDQAKALGVQP
jgi:protein O-mannosyl-transferase